MSNADRSRSTRTNTQEFKVSLSRLVPRGPRRTAVAVVAAVALVAVSATSVVAGIRTIDPGSGECVGNSQLRCATVLNTTTTTDVPRDDPAYRPEPDKSFSGTTAGQDGGDNDATGWFVWDAPQAGTTILVPGLTGGKKADVVSVHTLAGGVEVPDAQESDLDSVDSDAAEGDQETGVVSFVASKGVRYAFAVSSADPSDRNNPAGFSYTIWQTTDGGPSNDSLGSALAVDQAVTKNGDELGTLDSGSLSGATLQPGETPGGGRQATVWYSWTVPNAGAKLAVTASGGVTLAAYTLATTQPEPDPDVPDALPALDEVDGPSAGAATLEGAAGALVYLQVSGGAQKFALSATRTGFKVPDTTPPTVECEPVLGWLREASVSCTAADTGSGIAADTGVTVADGGKSASFTLAVELPANVVTTSAASAQRTICDGDGNCVTAGPITGIKIDTVPPVVSCEPVGTTWQSATTAAVKCTATDGGSSATDVVTTSGLANPADAEFTMATVEIDDNEQNGTAAFRPYRDATPTEKAPLGTVCDLAGNCAPVTIPAGEADESGAAPTAKLDKTKPAVTCDTKAVIDTWLASNGTVSCTATDTGSGLADGSMETFELSTQVSDGAVDANAATGSVAICDKASNCATVDAITGFKIDRSPPTVTCETPEAGTWFKGNRREVPCTVTDAGSGFEGEQTAKIAVVATIPADTESTTLTLEMPELCDVAGNCAASPTISGFGLDDVAPTVTCTEPPSTWQSTADVSVTCVSDPRTGSALKLDADESFELVAALGDGETSDSVAFSTHADVCDAAGNCAAVPAVAVAKIDRTAPLITCEMPDTAAREAGFIAEVVISCTASDAGSGLANPEHRSFMLTTSVGPGLKDESAELGLVEVVDAVGNSYTAGNVAKFGQFSVNREELPAAPTWTGMPTKVTVLDARVDSAEGNVPVPYQAPTAVSDVSVLVGCTPDGTGRFPVGTTIVSCSARDGADQIIDGDFVVDVARAPELAPEGTFTSQSRIPVAGEGFSGPVTVEFDGTTIATLTPDSGVIDARVEVPSGSTLGEHVIVVRGRGADAQQRLIVAQVSLAGVDSTSTEPATPEPSASATPEPSASATPEPSASVTPEPSASVTPEPSEPSTPEPSASTTPEPSESSSPSPTLPTAVPTDSPTPTQTPTPTPTPTSTSTPTTPTVPVTVPKLRVSGSASPERDRKSPYKFTHSVRISGAKSCVGTAETTASVKVTKVVTTKVNGKKKKVKVTFWRAVDRTRTPVKSCSIQAGVSFKESELPTHRGAASIRLRTIFVSSTGVRLSISEPVKAG